MADTLAMNPNPRVLWVLCTLVIFNKRYTYKAYESDFMQYLIIIETDQWGKAQKLMCRHLAHPRSIGGKTSLGKRYIKCNMLIRINWRTQLLVPVTITYLWDARFTGLVQWYPSRDLRLKWWLWYGVAWCTILVLSLHILSAECMYCKCGLWHTMIPEKQLMKV